MEEYVRCLALTPAVCPLVRALCDKLVDKVALAAHDLHTVVPAKVRKLRASTQMQSHMHAMHGV